MTLHELYEIACEYGVEHEKFTLFFDYDAECVTLGTPFNGEGRSLTATRLGVEIEEQKNESDPIETIAYVWDKDA